ncbi:MAG: PAS domain S-box protein [Ferruginibacter sp.]
MIQSGRNNAEQLSPEMLSKKLMEQSAQLKKENEELRKAHKELKTLFESINEVLYSVDMVSNKLLQVSAACEKVYGYTAADFFADGNLWQNVIHPDDKEISQQQVQLLNQGKQVVNQYRIIHKDKSVRWIENKITSTLDEKGRLIRLDGVTNDITDRKIAEKKLEESVSIMEATIESTADGILVADLNGKIIKFNKKFVELWHIPGEILETKDDNKAINYVLDQLADPEKFLSKLNELQNRPKEVSFDILEFKDGRIFERYSQPQLIYEECAGRVWSFRDITKRRNDGEALKESESQLALATKIAKLGHWEFDAIKGLFTFNDQFYSLFKTTAEKVGGYIMDPQRYSELFVFPDDRDFVNGEMVRTMGALEIGPNNKLEHRITYANGEIGWISVNFFLIKNDAGVTIKTFGVNQDITDHKKAEEALRLAQFTIENTTHAIYWIKSDGSFHMVNNAATQMLGFSFEELMQLNVPGIDPFYNKEVWDGFWQAIMNQKFMRLITKHIRKDGTLIDVQIDTHYFRFENMEMSCAFVSDITERKLHEELLQKSEANLEIKNNQLELKNKELEQFAYVASHDLQEPLRTISSFVELIQKQYKGKLDINADKYLSFIAQSSDRMKVLIKNLLDYSRIGAKKELEQVDCNQMMHEVLADLGAAINDANAEIHHNRLPVISGYPTEIKQLFQNLIINAVKFQKKGVAPQIKISAQRTKDTWEFSFQDNGIGIEKQHREKIFNIFQRLHTRSEYAGSGIGLSHCKKIVELHNGKIWVESVPNEGSTFNFTIQAN